MQGVEVAGLAAKVGSVTEAGKVEGIEGRGSKRELGGGNSTA